MTDNPNKKTFWDKVHLDPTMLLILLALLVYSALVIWSASGQDIGMMERKIGQIAMGHPLIHNPSSHRRCRP